MLLDNIMKQHHGVQDNVITNNQFLFIYCENIYFSTYLFNIFIQNYKSLHLSIQNA